MRLNDAPHALTVLVVDDDADTAESLAELLVLHGHAVRVALDGAGALRLADADPPDVVLLDVRMPGLDGCAVAQLIRERCRARAKRPFLVAVTGCHASDPRIAMAEASFDLHLVKPVDPAVLIGVLERFRRLFAPPTPVADLPPDSDPEDGGGPGAFSLRFAFVS